MIKNHLTLNADNRVTIGQALQEDNSGSDKKENNLL